LFFKSSFTYVGSSCTNFWSLPSSQELLQAVDCRPWNSLAKRRVQHYGYEFRYDVSFKDYLDFSLSVSVVPKLVGIQPFFQTTK